VSTVLAGGVVADFAGGDVNERDLVVDGDRIGSGTATERVDVSGCLVMPGNVCTHHHLYSALARGMPGPSTQPRNFVEILEQVWWRLDRALDFETIELSARLGATEAAMAGTTSVIDHHASPNAIDSSLDAVAEGIAASGLRAAVCYEISDRHGEDGGRAGVEENARFLRANRRPLVRGMVGAHASFTVGPDTLERLVAVARDAGAPIHIHVAEDDADERDSIAKYRVRTAQRLASAGALAKGDLIAHGVHLNDEEIELVKSSDAWVLHNPRSNMNNCVGYAPVLDLGPRVALGTDGLDGDMFSEARTCYLKGREASPTVGPSWATDRLAAGARVMGAAFGEPDLGTLLPGAPADLIVLDYRPPTPLSTGNLAGHFLFGMGAWTVRDVMVAGRWIVRDRRHQLIDEEELAARCRAAAPSLWARMEDL
jgi:putative selenium metabolism protein SsnA